MEIEFPTKVGDSTIVRGANGQRILTLSLTAKGYRFYRGSKRGGSGPKRLRCDRETAWEIWTAACQKIKTS